MKRLLIAAWIAVVAFGPLKLNCPAQTGKANSQTEHRPSPQPPTPLSNIATTKDDSPTGHKAEESQEKPIRVTQMPPESAWYKSYVIATIVLIGVGSLGVYKAHQTLRALKIQAGVMGMQLDEMKNTGARMDRQTSILEESVKAANASAKAAQENIELFINKDRARLRVQVGNLELGQESKANIVVIGIPGPTQLFKDIDAYVATYWVSFYGPTPAFITDSRVVARVTELRELPIDYSGQYALFMHLPEIISSDTKLEAFHALLQPKIFLEDKDIESIKREDTFVHFYGFIKYNDTFERPRKTSFHFRWQVGKAILGEGEGQWIKCGPPEDNQAT